jgi:hypothetical protein
VDHDTSDVSSHLRRERLKMLPISLLSQGVTSVLGVKGLDCPDWRPNHCSVPAGTGIATSAVSSVGSKVTADFSPICGGGYCLMT